MRRMSRHAKGERVGVVANIACVWVDSEGTYGTSAPTAPGEICSRAQLPSRVGHL